MVVVEMMCSWRKPGTLSETTTLIDRNGQGVWRDKDTAKPLEYSLGTAASSEKATSISLCTVFWTFLYVSVCLLFGLQYFRTELDTLLAYVDWISFACDFRQQTVMYYMQGRNNFRFGMPVVSGSRWWHIRCKGWIISDFVCLLFQAANGDVLHVGEE